VERLNDHRPAITARVANASDERPGHPLERQTPRLVMATSVRGSNRPQQAPGSSPQAKNFQSAP
jgi:hypothetical protein